ncbi:unnamed protein product, partial [Scytosiphon promiscuus]
AVAVAPPEHQPDARGNLPGQPSLYGGFVKWQKGEREDARDSIAVQVADEHHWPEMRALILVVSADKK